MAKLNRKQFHATLPPLLEAAARRKAKKLGIPFGNYLQNLIQQDLQKP